MSNTTFYLNFFLCVNTDKKRIRRDFLGCYFNNHCDECVSVSVEELVPKEHFLHTIEGTISFDFIKEKQSFLKRITFFLNE
ncbi:hypothetical protein COK56_19680 [Bacillus cereus]|nr:hypothetical protein CON05_14880 [Bacillus cereus]PFS68146.1 hypothetical protein COK41_00820 [Bacillus cereus]PFS76752.1 hypothetical protein COK56_19680 [Bacillus cereus]PGU43058.1 hypothetical protein COD91_15405 [Bacillus cereus]